MNRTNPRRNEEQDYSEEYIGSVHIETMKMLISGCNFVDEKNDDIPAHKPFFRKIRKNNI